jgi:hypothetical protein
VALRRVIRDRTGQDLHKCQACYDCSLDLPGEMDVPLPSLIEMVLLDDEEALETRTLWSDAVLEASRGACKRGLNLHAVMLGLREEHARRAGGMAVQVTAEETATGRGIR